MRRVGRRRRRQIRDVGQRGEQVGAPQEALAGAEEVRLRPRRIGQVRAEHAAAGVPHDEHEAAASAAVLVGLRVQRRQRHSVLLQAVHHVPRVDELEARRDEQPDFLGEPCAEQAAGFTGRGFVAVEGEGRERGRLEGARDAPGRLEDAVHVCCCVVRRDDGTCAVRVCGCLCGLRVEAAEEAAHGVGDGVGEVGGGRRVVLVL